MAKDSLRVEIGGAEVDGLYDDLLELEVELDAELAGLCRITLALLLRPDGTWSHLDDERLVVWQPITVTAGLADDTRELLSGYITHVRPEFGDDLDRCRLQVWGMDAGVLMDRVDVCKEWPNKKDSDIAEETFRIYSLDTAVTDTVVIHDEEVSTIIQRETDMQFLQRLANRNGFECFVEGRTGHFRPPAVAGSGLPVLAAQFGDETSVTTLGFEVNAFAAADVAMSQVDRLTRTVLDARAEAGVLLPLGARPAGAFLTPGMAPGLVRVGATVATGTPEMVTLCQSLRDRGEWFVTAEGEVDAHRYGAVLTPRTTVVVKGVGETYSGTYYLTRVVHRFTPDGYTQRFTAKRNGLGPTGTEDFTGGDPLGRLL
jgi:hypothetical protein